MEASKLLPMDDLKLFGIYRNGNFTIPEEQVMALKSGGMTDIIELKDLKSKERDIHIEKLPAKLSIVKGDDGKPSLRIDPVYIKENDHPLLTDLEKTRLIREGIANIKKDYVDQQGNIQSRVIEYDQHTKQFVSFDPNKVKPPIAVDAETMTPEKKRKYQEGELVELADGTQFQIRPSDRRGVRSNKSGLVLSVLIDGGISYLLVTGIQRLLGKQSPEQRSYSAGYLDAIKEVQKQNRSKVNRNPDDKEAARMLDEANFEYSVASGYSAIDKLKRINSKNSSPDSDQEKNHGKDGGKRSI